MFNLLISPTFECFIDSHSKKYILQFKQKEKKEKMKKFLGILVLGLMLCNTVFSVESLTEEQI